MPTTRARPARRFVLLAIILGLAVVTGCGVAPQSSPGPPKPSPTLSPDTSPPTAAPGPTTAAEVREQGTTSPRLGGHLTVFQFDGVTALDVERTAHPAAERWIWTPGRTDDLRLALFAAPEDARFAVLGDRSLVVTDSSGTPLVGVAPLAPGTFELLDADLLLIRAHAEDPEARVHAWFGETAVLSATWGHAEGGRSLAVEPAPWTRAAGEAGAVMAWRHIEQMAPDDATSGMHDQLVCHAVGAPNKPTWNLEPWRPDVGLLAVLAAACNPT